MEAKTKKKQSEAPVNTANNGLASFNEIHIVMTYLGYDPIEWWFRRSLGPEVRKLQKEYYLSSAADQEKNQYESRFIHLSKVAKRHPKSLPGYDSNGTPEECIVRYFQGQKEDLEDVLDLLWTMYENRLYPKELLPSASK